MRFRVLRAVLASCLVATGAVTLHAVGQSNPDLRMRPVADAQSASDESVAFAIAERYGHPVVIGSATSETELVEAQPDHSKVLTENTEPVRVKQNGAWVATDENLQATDGIWQPAAAAIPVQFSVGGAGPLARVRAPSGQWLAESWSAGELPAPSVHGSTATYADVYPGVDLVLTATAVGMSEVLVISDAEAAANPALSAVSFGVEDGSLQTTAQAGGSAVARDTDGSAQLTAAAATWWDSSSPGASFAGPGGRGVPQPVTETVSDSQVEIDASIAARTAGARYPVYVDPVWTGGELGWAMVDSAHENQAYWKDALAADGNQHVGYIDAGHGDGEDHKTRSYWQMDTHQVVGTRITSALFNTTEVYSYSCSARDVSLYTAGAITPSTTWKTQPGLSAWSDTKTVAHGYDASCPAAGVAFDAAAAVQRAADASSPVINLALVASDTDYYGWKKFSGSASLRVAYYSIPTVPVQKDLGPCWAVCHTPGAITSSTTPNLTAVSTIARDPNTGAPEHTLRYVWEVCTRQPDGKPGGCRNYLRTPVATSGAEVSVTMLSTEPATEGSWEWRALACRTDIGDACSDWSDWYPFTVDTTAPPAPKISSASFDLTGQERRGREHVPGQLTVTGGNASDDYAFTYSATPGATQLTGTACSNAMTEVVMQCPGTGDVSTFTALPQLPTSNSVSVYAYDRAGNLSAPGCLAVASTTCGPAIRYDVNFAIANHPQHAWVFTPADAQSGATTLQDAAPGTAQTSTLGTSGTPPAYLPSGPIPSDPVMSFDGSQYLGSEAGALTNDEGHSFTAAIWVRPTGTGQVMTALSQGTKDSAFQLLQTADGHFQFCMANTGGGQVCTPLRDGLQATRTSHLAGAGMDWVLLVAVWNAPARTMLLYAADANDSSRYATVVRGVGRTSTEPVLVGSAMSNGTAVNGWSGGIGDVLLYQAVLDPSQLNALHLAPQNLG